jgi:hypothetical protein
MFKSLLNFFKRKPATGSTGENQATADGLRKYAKVTYVTPARQRGEKRVSFNASDLHRVMDPRASYPLICSAIDSKKFTEFARVSLVKREGAKQGASARWTFKIL